ncbi:ADAL protein, partial [Polypterus senegalus]|nr:ADAL protein [Polypterus senegalus]
MSGGAFYCYIRAAAKGGELRILYTMNVGAKPNIFNEEKFRGENKVTNDFKAENHEVIPPDLYQKLPKVELHAHLNGSVSPLTLERLIAKKPHLNIEHSMTVISKGQSRTLEECFEMFKVIHQLTNTEEVIFEVTKDVIKEFAADGVKYLELRSTPREEKSTGLTKKRYVETVIEAIKQSKEENADIEVRFLLAIDRRHGPAVAMDTVKMAEDFSLLSNGIVVGLDLSGDPMAGHGKDYIPALQRAKNVGLKLALHLSEVPNQKEETELLLTLPPDRIGHGTFLHPEVGGSQELVDYVRKNCIPLELCMTSNVKGQTVASYDKHHFLYWYNLQHPCILCTDDKGVFATELSTEYELAATTFSLNLADIWSLSTQAIDCSFAPSSVKCDLHHHWLKLKREMTSTLRF